MRILYFFIALILFISCDNPQKKETVEIKEEETNTDLSIKITNGIGEILTSETRKTVENWSEYQSLSELIDKYYSTSAKDAITNATDLTKAIKLFKDSVRVEKFKRPDIEIRINVLHNSALRLQDMSEIPKIDIEEVKTEVGNTLNAFSAINSKMNNIIQQESLEKELIDFQEEVKSNN